MIEYAVILGAVCACAVLVKAVERATPLRNIESPRLRELLHRAQRRHSWCCVCCPTNDFAEAVEDLALDLQLGLVRPMTRDKVLRHVQCLSPEEQQNVMFFLH